MDSVNTTIPKPSTTAFLLGVATVIAQSTLLREAMAAMGGSEMAWGLVMALWLAGMGIGSRAGVRIGSARIARALPILSLFLTAAGVLLFRAAPAILRVSAGESLTTLHALWLWTLAIVPAASAGGLAFPILAELLGSHGPGRAYTLEAAGALVGGLVFTTLLVPLGTSTSLLLAIAAVGGVELWRIRPLLAVLFVVLCSAAAVPAGLQLAEAGWKWSGRPGELGCRAETRLQRLETSNGLPTALYADGRLRASYPDPFGALPAAHLMMLLHPDPKKVFAVGCGSDGSVEALIRHPVDELLVVEDDPEMLPLLARWYGDGFRATLDHPSVRILEKDPLPALLDQNGLDLIILADGDPTTLRANRTRTVEFFSRCRTAMNDSGVLVVRVSVADTYLGGTAGNLLTTLAATLTDVFPRVLAVPGERVLLVAGGPQAQLSLKSEDLRERLLSRPDAASAMPSTMLSVLIDPGRQEALSAFIAHPAAPHNTVNHPRAVAYAAALHEARSQPKLARNLADQQHRGPMLLISILGAVIAGLLAIAARPGRGIRAMAAAWVVGATSMGWWLLLLAVWQAARGSVYAEIGALTGLFMAGVALGGWFGLKTHRPSPALLRIISGGLLLSLLIAAGIPLMAATPLVPTFLVTGGILTGAAFPNLGKLAGGGSPRKGAGNAFAADEIGAAAAALTIGTIAIPWVGITATAVGLALLGLAAIPAVLRG